MYEIMLIMYCTNGVSLFPLQSLVAHSTILKIIIIILLMMNLVKLYNVFIDLGYPLIKHSNSIYKYLYFVFYWHRKYIIFNNIDAYRFTDL